MQPSRCVPGWCRGATRSPSTRSPRTTGSRATRPQRRWLGPRQRAITPTMQYRTSSGGRPACSTCQGWRRRTAHDDDGVDLEPHWRPSERVEPPRGRGLRRRLLRRAPKSIAGRYYELLSGYAAIGPYLRDNIRKTDDDRFWWCGGGNKQKHQGRVHQCEKGGPGGGKRGGIG